MNQMKQAPDGMSVATAQRLEFTIIGIGVIALVMIFQPFSLTLFGIGCGLVVFAGLANNLLPLCQPGKSLGTVVRVALLIAVIFVIVAALGIGSAFLYGIYLTAGK